MDTEDQPDYVSALHLRSRPFESGADSNVFFADPALTQRLDQIQHLAQFGGLMLVIEGEAGSGKTTFLKELVKRAGDGWKVCQIQGDVNVAFSDVMRQIARQFDLDDEGHPDNLGHKIFDFCQVMVQTSQLPVVIVDDADRMPLSVLERLLALGGAPDETLKHVRILLFGIPGLQESLVRAGVCNDHSLIHSVIMHPLDEAQTDAYLVYRLAMAGFSGPSPFSSMEVRAIHKSALGLPLRINRLAHQTLMEHVWAVPRPFQGPRQGSRAPLRVKFMPGKLSGEGKWLAGGVAAVLVAGILWLVGPEPESDDVDIARGMVSEQLTLPVSDQPLPEVAPEDVRQAHIEPREPRTEAPVSELAVATAENDDAPPSPILLPVPIRPPEETAAEVLADEPAASPATEGSVAAAMIVPDAGDETPDEPVGGDQPAAVVVPPSAAPEPRAESGTQPGVPPVPRVAKPPLVAPAPSAPSTVQREDWLLHQSPDALTLQLLGVSKESSLQRFLAEHPVPGPAAYFHTLRNGKHWYVLVQGVYSDRNTARAAVGALPEALRKGKPWPRTFESIQADIQPSGAH